MEIGIRKVQQVTVVEIAGEIDGKTAPEVQSQVLPLIQPNAKILLDMSQVGYMSSAGLRMLLVTYRQVTSNKARIVLVGLSEDIEDTMSATGFLGYFTTCDSLDAGLGTLE